MSEADGLCFEDWKGWLPIHNGKSFEGAGDLVGLHRTVRHSTTDITIKFQVTQAIMSDVILRNV